MTEQEAILLLLLLAPIGQTVHLIWAVQRGWIWETLSRVKRAQRIAANPTLSCLEFFVKRLVFFLALFAVPLVGTPPFLWREAGQIFRVR